MPVHGRRDANLSLNGAIIQATIMPSEEICELMDEGGLKIPMCEVKALIDTGSRWTAIDSSVANVLKLNATEKRTVNSFGGKGQFYFYDIGVAFEFLEGRILGLEAFAGDLPPGFNAVLGRDLLESAIFQYNGKLSTWKLNI